MRDVDLEEEHSAVSSVQLEQMMVDSYCVELLTLFYWVHHP